MRVEHLSTLLKKSQVWIREGFFLAYTILQHHCLNETVLDNVGNSIVFTVKNHPKKQYTCFTICPCMEPKCYLVFPLF